MIDPATPNPAIAKAFKAKAQAAARLAKRLRGRVNKIRGDHAEAVVAHRLRGMGLLCIVPLATGWRVQRKGNRIVGAKPLAKVAGDFLAVLPGGRSVLVEVKRRADVLRLSDFQPHSRKALTVHDEAGGLSVVAWVSPKGIAFLLWRTFVPWVGVPWALAEVCSALVVDNLRKGVGQTPMLPATGGVVLAPLVGAPPHGDAYTTT